MMSFKKIQNTIQNSRSRENEEVIKSIPLMILAFVMILPVLYYARKSFPAGDDFVYAASMRRYLADHGSYLAAAWHENVDYYKSFSGLYFVTFLNCLISPLLRGGTRGIRIVNTILQTVSIACLFVLVRTFVRDILRKGSRMTWFLFCVLLFAIINNAANSQIYTWFCILVGYNLPVGIILLGVAFLIHAYATDNAKLYIPAAFCAFLGSGASLNITVLNCGLFLIYCCYGFVILQKKKGSLAVFLSAMAGGIINAVCPGNFTRHDSMSNGINLVAVIRKSAMYSLDRIINRLFNPAFLVILIVLFVVLLISIDYSECSFNFRYLIPGALIVWFGVFLVDLPVFMGYGGTSIPDRCKFVQDMTIYLLSFLWLLYFTGWVKKRFGNFVFSNEHGMILAVILILSLSISINMEDDGIMHFGTPYMISTIVNGDLEDYVHFEYGLMDRIRDYDGADVVFDPGEIPYNPYIQYLYIDTDPEHWMNQALAEYYGKNTVRVEYND